MADQGERAAGRGGDWLPSPGPELPWALWVVEREEFLSLLLFLWLPEHLHDAKKGLIPLWN